MKYFDPSNLFKILINKIDFTGKKVLDLGCGEGSNTIWISQYASEVVGLDQSKSLINFCNHKILTNGNLNVKFIGGNADNLPFENCYFDVIFTFWSLHEFKNFDKSFNEIMRVLKKNGIIVSVEPLQKSDWTSIEYLIKKIYHSDKFMFTDIFWIKYLSYLHKLKFNWDYYLIKPRYVFPNISIAYNIIKQFFHPNCNSNKCKKDIKNVISNLPRENEKISFIDDSLLLIAKREDK